MTPLRLARQAATPTVEELAARTLRKTRRGAPNGGDGITQAELAARVRELGGTTTSGTEICRWELHRDDPNALRASKTTRRLLEQALGLPAGALDETNACPHCHGKGFFLREC